MENVVWSSNSTKDYISGMGEEEKFNTLVDRGYDPEMLGNAENMDDVISTDDYMWQADSDEFDNEILPMINSQTKDGMVICLSGDEAKIVYAEDLKGGDIDPESFDVRIIEGPNGGLIWQGSSGAQYELFAVPEDEGELIDFCTNCMGDYLAEVGEGEDPTAVIEDLAVNLTPEVLEMYCNFANVPDNARPIMNNLMNESLNEQLNEASTKDPQGLAAELEKIKPLADEYGFEYFTAMPYENFDNDPQSLEYQYPKFANVVKQCFIEMYSSGDTPEETRENRRAMKQQFEEDPDYLEDLWYGVTEDVWSTIMKVSEILARGESAQVDHVDKDNFTDVIDDKPVETDIIEDESLNEERISREEDVVINGDYETPEDIINEIRNEWGCPKDVDVEVVEFEGPGGGWPIVRFSGEADLVNKFLADIGFDENDEDNYYISK